MNEPIRWGVLGASKFALGAMARAIHSAEGSELAALATSSEDKAAPFRAFQPRLRVHADYQALLDDAEIDAVYIPLPNAMHVEWTLKALDAGKHVLCEKPLAMKASEFEAVIAKRDETGLVAAEAYMIVHHPQWIRARELVQGGAIGELRHVEAAFSFNNTEAGNIRNKPETGGGGLPDIGVYAFGSVRFVTGQEPVAIRHANIRYENGVDVYAQVAADFESFEYSGMVSMRLFPRQEVTFHGDKGVLKLLCPFNPNVFGHAEMTLETEGKQVVHERWPGVDHYKLQVENFTAAIHGADYPCPLEFSRGTQAMIDMVYAAGGNG
ncbi:Gfo/Idh/MocA family protein [Limimaricola litoreus]|uniref:Gfo/Idh/MocA family oxidoreductase n=1 Tax=Limimaricola litoreus TaxID=2955316 RepID=A0A9X2FVF8_9RHOB|nr:Gfo/Idh/MocA family oxidoreductase [Limimaricola litoreus]MCP1169206.1 Gfo/Idh/MocA family oxidoreductase [Limimaricola litoreus]